MSEPSWRERWGGRAAEALSGLAERVRAAALVPAPGASTAKPEPRPVVYRPVMSPKELQGVWYGDEVPASEQWRRYFGSGVTPALIEQCVLSSMRGYLRDFTDLSYEMLMVDPDVSCFVGKRMRAVAHVEPVVEPASGDGIDPKKAELYADVVREQLRWIPQPRKAWTRLAWGHFHGRSLLEKTWKEAGPRSRVKWRIDALHWVHPRRLALGPERELRIRDDVWQGGTFEARGFDIREAPQKFIAFQPQLFDDYPEREGLALRAVYPSYFKRWGTKERLAVLEVYGHPWKHVEGEAGVTVQKEMLDAAKASADKMGGWSTGAMPPGVKLVLTQLGQNAAQGHKELVADCNDALAKLILTATRTTDAKPDALGGDAARVHQDGELLTIATDCANLGDVATEGLAVDIIVLNYGPEEASHAPRIRFPFELKPDRTVEIERTTKTLAIGIPLKLEEVYERTGFEKPDAGDAIIQQSAGSPGPFGPGAPSTSIVDPNAPQPPPAPPAAPPPVAPPAPAAPPTPAEADDEEEPAAAARLEVESVVLRAVRASTQARLRYGDRICCAAQPETVNGSPDVLIETGVKEGARITAAWANALGAAVEGLDKGGEIFEALARASQELPLAGFARATERRLLHGAMLGALDSSWEIENEQLITVEAFTAPRVLAREEFEPGDVDRKFVTRPFDQAVKLFKEREVLTPDRFAQLSAAAKRRAFSIAKLARQELLATAHAELGRQLETGAVDLGDFKKLMADRIESAGWTPANASHVETIFRTNIIGGYSAGRHTQMTEPATLALRPFWQIFTVRDDRARDTHKKAHGTVLPADHAFWKKAYAPFGYNCRCRVVSRGKGYENRVTAAPEGLPDEGFDSGTPVLMSAEL